MTSTEQQTQNPSNLPKPPAWFAQRYGVMPPSPPTPAPSPPPVEFRFECPHCGQHFVAELDMVGRKLECPGCVKKFIIPNP